MQITGNSTGMDASIAIVPDKDARDHCVVAVKGTFLSNGAGELRLADLQRPLVTADEHYGDPAATCVRYECDFALAKTLTDVIVVGMAVAPSGQRVAKLLVHLEVQGRAKSLTVHGDRHWQLTHGSLRVSRASEFEVMPITFDRAWGGQDDSRGPEQVEVESRNLTGIGFHPHRSPSEIAGRPVPNIEAHGKAISSPRERYEPAGFGCIGRGWHPRLSLAGTFDENWRTERAPYLPGDFDTRYFQSAPLDQQFPLFRGGETIRCVHMADQIVNYVIPRLHVPVLFRFSDVDVERTALLDTIVVEPHLQLATLVFRASVPMRKRLTALKEILVGTQQKAGPIGYRHGKPIFKDLGAAVRWLRERRGRML